jgi:hypothetical protein
VGDDKMKGKNIIIICALICATLIVCGVLFWPTLYRYEKIGGKLPVRINRLTGYTEILSISGWERKVSNKEIQEIPKEEIGKIETRGAFDGEGHYKFDVYNGTHWTIRKIKLSIGLKDGNGKKLWQKVYETMANIRPFSTGSCSIELIDYVPIAKKAGDYTIQELEAELARRGLSKVSPKREIGEYLGPLEESTSDKKKHELGPPVDKSKIRVSEVRLEGAFGYK